MASGAFPTKRRRLGTYHNPYFPNPREVTRPSPRSSLSRTRLVQTLQAAMFDGPVHDSQTDIAIALFLQRPPSEPMPVLEVVKFVGSVRGKQMVDRNLGGRYQDGLGMGERVKSILAV